MENVHPSTRQHPVHPVFWVCMGMLLTALAGSAIWLATRLNAPDEGGEKVHEAAVGEPVPGDNDGLARAHDESVLPRQESIGAVGERASEERRAAGSAQVMPEQSQAMTEPLQKDPAVALGIGSDSGLPFEPRASVPSSDDDAIAETVAEGTLGDRPPSVGMPIDTRLPSRSEAAGTSYEEAIDDDAIAGALVDDRTQALAQGSEECGAVSCQAGAYCCNPTCGLCVQPGETCPQTAPCTRLIPFAADSVACGPSTCNVGEYCCNPSCGICAPQGRTCDQRVCENTIEIPFSMTCGMATCNVGMVCCNPSCGLCAPAGACSEYTCD